MAKLTSAQKQLFSMWCDVMENENIFWTYCRETGITIVYQIMPGGKFIRASVAYCSKEDPKIGLNAAMERWDSGEFILLHVQNVLQFTICNFASACVGEAVDLVHITPEDYWLVK